MKKQRKKLTTGYKAKDKPIPRSHALVSKMTTWLHDNKYKTAGQLAIAFGESTGMIYAVIKQMRLRNTGVLTVYRGDKRGYVLSKDAVKQDDVHFMRRCRGRRASDYIALMAAGPDMEARWNSVADRRAFSTMFKPFRTSPQILDKSQQVIKLQMNKLGL